MNKLKKENEALKQAIQSALEILRGDLFATRAYNAATELENALEEWGCPDVEE